MHENVSLIRIFFIDKMLVNCSVCLGDINLFDKEISILNCGHFFHANCVNDWLQHKMNCPECRAIVIRGNLARNISPKINQEMVNKFKSLKDKFSKLQNENFVLKMKNTFLKKSKLINCNTCIYIV